MKIKKFIFIIGIQIFIGIIFYKNFPEFLGEALALITVCSLFLAWLVQQICRDKIVKNKIKDSTIIKDKTDEEYHNDFSKVPAGSYDGKILPPRSIGFGHGVGDKTMLEDLERIGLKDIDQNKK